MLWARNRAQKTKYPELARERLHLMTKIVQIDKQIEEHIKQQTKSMTMMAWGESRTFFKRKQHVTRGGGNQSQT